MLRTSLICILSIVPLSWAFGQQAKLRIKAIPQKTIVLLNNDTVGKADRAVLHLGFNNRKGIDSHIVVFSAPGYVEERFIFTSDNTDRNTYFDIRLNRKLPTFKGETDFFVDWRPVVSGIPYGTELGAGTKWLYRYNKNVLDIKAQGELHEALDAMNLNLFDSLPDARKRLESGDSARLMLQGIVESYTLRRGLRSEGYSSYYKAYTATVSVRWQMIDSSLDSLLLDQPFASVYEYRGISTIGFHDAIVDNFYRFAQSDSALLNAMDQIHRPRPIEQIGRLEEVEGDSGMVLSENGQPKQPDTKSIEALNDESLTDTLDQQTNRVDTLQSIAGEEADQTTRESAKQELAPTVSASKSENPEFVFQKPSSPATRSSAESSTVFVVNAQDEIIGGGVVITKDGYALCGARLEPGEQVMIRFVNGVKLMARVEKNMEEEDLVLLKIDANNLKAQIASDLPKTSTSTVRLPTTSNNDIVGVTWRTCTLDPANTSCVVMDKSPHGLPIYSNNYTWVGMVLNTTEDHDAWMGAGSILKALGIRYE